MRPLNSAEQLSRAERLSAILESLVRDGRLEVDAAAVAFAVSRATIRRDLDHLAEQQLLTRTHGGALANTTSYDVPMRYRTTRQAEVKSRLAARAVQLLWPGCTVSLNGGTTLVEVARAIPTVDELRSGVTVVTNALNIAVELIVRPFVKIVVCGGVARSQSYELVGPLAGQSLEQLTTDICFLGATGVDHLAGVTTNDEDEAAVNRMMVRRAKRTVLIVDSSKIGTVDFCRICTMAEIDTVLTDTDAAASTVAELASLGPDIIQV